MAEGQFGGLELCDSNCFGDFDWTGKNQRTTMASLQVDGKNLSSLTVTWFGGAAFHARRQQRACALGYRRILKITLLTKLPISWRLCQTTNSALPSVKYPILSTPVVFASLKVNTLRTLPLLLSLFLPRDSPTMGVVNTNTASPELAGLDRSTSVYLESQVGLPNR
jgi:hypothetical protein